MKKEYNEAGWRAPHGTAQLPEKELQLLRAPHSIGKESLPSAEKPGLIYYHLEGRHCAKKNYNYQTLKILNGMQCIAAFI